MTVNGWSRRWGGGRTGLGLAAAVAMSAAAAMPSAAIDVAPDVAAELFGLRGTGVVVSPPEGTPPSQRVSLDGEIVGHIASTWEVARSAGYSGRPIDILVAVDRTGIVRGTRLVTQNEPILVIGISPRQLEDYVARFAGIDPRQSVREIRAERPAIADGITGATLSSSVIRDAIIRTARTVASSYGTGRASAAAQVDRTAFVPTGWPQLISEGAVAGRRLTNAEVSSRLPAQEGVKPEDTFIDLYVALATPAMIGQNLLARRDYESLIASIHAEDSAILIAASGLYSFKGTGWRRSGRFERVQIVQGSRTFGLTTAGYRSISSLAAEGAPSFREVGVFVLPGSSGFDPTLPWRLSLIVERQAGAGPVSATFDLPYHLPERLVSGARTESTDAAAAVPLWQEIWRARAPAIAFVTCLLLSLYVILIFQDALVRRVRLYRIVRLTFLGVTLAGLGWGLGVQLSVVHILTFVDGLLTGFQWQRFLLDPLVFIVWGWLAVALLFWGRGVFCGWLCPFGALQELLNEGARKIGIRQIDVPFALHERLWPLKYILFLGLLAISLNSMTTAFVAAEVEPFKTAITLKFAREWPFIAYAAGLLVAGLFIERFYCRYLCPMGAGLAIPARLRMFDWLKRRHQCGRECRICATRCTVQAIHPDGHINPNECIHCLNCQTLYYDASVCPPLKARARRRGGGDG